MVLTLNLTLCLILHSNLNPNPNPNPDPDPNPNPNPNRITGVTLAAIDADDDQDHPSGDPFDTLEGFTEALLGAADDTADVFAASFDRYKS